MEKRNKDLIIHKFLNNTATAEEIEFLTIWLDQNQPKFEAEIKLHHLISGAIAKENAERLKMELLERFAKNNNIHKKPIVLRILKYAAVFLGLLAVGALYFLQNEKDQIRFQENVTITLSDGIDEEIVKTDGRKTVAKTNTFIAQQEGDQIVYQKNDTVNGLQEPLVYHTLNVPYGKKFQIVLSDSTKIYLNSGSSITYPVVFNSKGPRNVMLRGEGYFEVKSDSSRPFYVRTEFTKSKVLGTAFNVSAYDDDQQTRIVLVEGSLKVKKREASMSRAILLQPNQMASYDYSKSALTSKIVDISSYIAWKDGILLFKNEDFYRISKKLERHYNISISFDQENIGKERYTGRFETETIEEVLTAFQRIKGFDYSMKGNKIKIKPNQ